MIVFPNAKINLGLRVLRKRNDGYHDLETVFYPVPVCDILEIILTPAPESAEQNRLLRYSGPVQDQSVPLPGGRLAHFQGTGLPVLGEASDNLVIKAVNLFDRRFGINQDVSIFLHKIIPMGSGLGGGSSDAAFTLMALCRLFNIPVETGELLQLAAELGSDCPFFILNEPSYATGRGELLQPVSLSLKGYHLMIVKPPDHVSTAAAFAGITPGNSHQEVRTAIEEPIETWQQKLVNDFERSVFLRHPLTGEIKKWLMDAGAVYASMSGSGSAVFGLFRNRVNISFYEKSCRSFHIDL